MARGTVPPNRLGRRDTLLASDPKVRDWYDERNLRSRLSADTYARQLSLVCDRLTMTPEEVVALARSQPEKLRSRLTKCASALKREGRLDSYISKWFEALKSYLRFRHIIADVFPRLSATKGESLSAERVPTPEELGRVLDRLSSRGRVIALLMAHSGLRPGAIGSYGGENGLRLQDILQDLKLGKVPEFSTVPFVIRVPAAISKTRAAYTTFGTSQLASALSAYLGQRKDRGEALLPSSPVVASAQMRGVARTSKEAAKFGHGFLSTKAVVEEIREALKSTIPEGVTWRPYVLRAYCSTRLMLAEGSGKISRDLREAILGHDGGVAARYNVGKRWGDDLLNEARAAYKRCEPFLSTVPTHADRDEREAHTRKLLLKVAGFTEEELKGIDVSTMPDSDLAKMVEDRLGKRAGFGPVERAYPISQVPELLQQGWAFVSTLGLDQAVVRSPSGLRSLG